MIPHMLEEEGSMIGRHLQDEIDIAGPGREIEDLVQVPETGDEKRPADRKTGSNNLSHLNLRALFPIQAILLVMFQQYITNIRYSFIDLWTQKYNKNTYC